jgi:hypothetical protein
MRNGQNGGARGQIRKRQLPTVKCLAAACVYILIAQEDAPVRHKLVTADPRPTTPDMTNKKLRPSWLKTSRSTTPLPKLAPPRANKPMKLSSTISLHYPLVSSAEAAVNPMGWLGTDRCSDCGFFVRFFGKSTRWSGGLQTLRKPVHRAFVLCQLPQFRHGKDRICRRCIGLRGK